MKQYAESFYKSRRWQRCRAAYIKSVGGLCEKCLAKGLVVPATMVHHKIHISPDNINDPSVTLSFDNLEALCNDCHAAEHGRLKRYEVDAFGHVIARQ